MARKLFERQAIRRRNGQLASDVAMVVYTDAAGTVLADISASSGGAAIAGSTVTTADIAGFGPSALQFWGPPSGQDTLYIRVPSDTSLGVQEIEAEADARLDALEAGGGGGGAAGADTIDPEAAPYSADGTGATNSAAGLAAAIAAAIADEKAVVARPGRLFRTDSTLTVSAACVIDLQGSTIKKGAALTSYALDVSGDDVIIRNLKVDGNRSGGATGGGIRWTGARGKVFDCESSHNKSSGWFIQDAGTTLDAWRSAGNDNVGGSANADGWIIWIGGLLRTYDCVANDNDRSGFFFAVSGTAAADGCRLDGSATGNGHAGAVIDAANNGTIGDFVAEASNGFGLVMSGHPSGWTAGTVRARNIGVAIAAFGLAVNDAATGIELYGASHCSFGTVESRGMPGYGLALTHDTASTGFKATNNQFGAVLVDREGAGNTDPAVHFSEGASHNSIGTAQVIGCSMALIFGEDGAVGPRHNHVGTLVADQCGYTALRINLGSFNRVDRIIASNVSNSDPTNIAKGVVAFQTSATFGNSVGWLEYTDDAALATARPLYLAHADSAAFGNRVDGGIARGFVTAASLDENGNNSFSLARAPIRLQIATFEAAETWTNTVANTTVGQFVQGSQGQKITGSSGYTDAQHVYGGAQNWAAVTADEFFRLYLYITNLADAGGSAQTMAVRFVDPGGGGNYFQKTWAAAELANGGQYLLWRKADMAVTGTVAWSSILSVNVLLYGAAGTITATCDDLCIIT